MPVVRDNPGVCVQPADRGQRRRRDAHRGRHRAGGDGPPDEQGGHQAADRIEVPVVEDAELRLPDGLQQQQGTGGDNPDGSRYLKMDVTLQVRDGSGVTSEIVRQPVKVYPNRQCGFSY